MKRIIIFESGFATIEQAQPILQEKSVKFLEDHGCDCAETVLKKHRRN